MERAELLEKLSAMMQQTVENGCTPDEAENAAHMMDALLIKYNLSLAEIKDVKVEDAEMTMDVPHDVTADGKRKYHFHNSQPDYVTRLGRAIGHLNFCEVIGNDAVILLGTKRDVGMANYMMETLLRQIRQQAIVERRKWVKEKWGVAQQPISTMYGKNHPKIWTESWVEGACSALASKFHQEVRQRDHASNDEPTMALVVNKRAAARAYGETQFPVWYGKAEPPHPAKVDKDKEEKEKYRQHNSDAWNRGFSTGRHMQVTHGVEGGAKLERLKE